MNDNEPWEASFPEEGDVIDQRVFVCHASAANWEVIELKEGTLEFKIRKAVKLAKLLNKVGAVIVDPGNYDMEDHG